MLQQRSVRAGLIACLLTVGLPGPAAPQVFPAPPNPAEAEAVRQALATMKGAERGPYERIRWFCNDGTIQPPTAGACSSRGGGVQHAEPNAQALRLAALSFNVGTILQALDHDAFADEARGGYRLRELVVERFLVDVDDGWVMRRARYYRGARQIEDEERAGRALLERRFADGAWLKRNYLLATRLAASLPHVSVGDAQTMDRIRAVSTQIAQADPGFQQIRVKIHSMPSEGDIASVERYLSRGSHSAEVRGSLIRLRDDLRLQYDPQRALASLALYERRVDRELAQGIARLRGALDSGNAQRSFEEIVRLAPTVRAKAESAGNGALAVDLVDLGLSLQERAYVLADRLEADAPTRTRTEALTRLGRYLTLAYSAGYLSLREHDALQEEVAALTSQGTATAQEYKGHLAYLARSLDWARGTVRGTFAPVLDRYALVEPASLGFYDAALRGSVMLPLSRVLDALQRDADRTLGATHSIFGATEASGLRGLNPGVAIGRLDVLEPGHHEEVDAGTIYLLPETPPELKPVAGVLTMDEGNLLSHVQLLARNLGIPNAAIAPRHEAVLLGARGQEIFYAVTPLGRVLVKMPSQLDEAERALLPDEANTAPTERHRLDTSRLRLDVRRPIPLADLRSTDSGVLVGPKAANLGQLAADFPGRVSDAVALPFGMFVEHANRPYGGTDRTVLEELRAASARAAAMRLQGRPSSEIDAFVLERLAWARQAIEALDWLPHQRTAVVDAVTSMLQGDVSRGVFVRSDTNVEDLPQFSGAGLNLTVPHQTSIDQILASVKRVWTSPFSERSYLWRSQILEEQGEVYPSVLIQQTVPSRKSGVLITSGLEEGGANDVTVVAAEGVGGAVEGEDAETILLRPSGEVRLLSQTKAPRRREVVTGGTRWVAASRPDTLLAPGEIAQLRAVVADWEAKTAGTPEADTTWDIEFGFLDGQLWLFQIRPFIRFRNSEVYTRLEALDAVALRNANRSVDLTGPLEGS